MGIKTSSFTVFLDGCVLYSAPLRDLLMELAAARLYRLKWSEDVLREWIENLLENRKDLERARLERTKACMQENVMDANVVGYEDLIPGLTLPDPDDRHVLAAAIRSKSDAIVTFNLRDFPPDYVSTFGVEVIHPDDFIFYQFDLDRASVINAARACRKRLKNPPRDAETYIRGLEAAGLPKTASELCNYGSFL